MRVEAFELEEVALRVDGDKPVVRSALLGAEGRSHLDTGAGKVLPPPFHLVRDDGQSDTLGFGGGVHPLLLVHQGQEGGGTHPEDLCEAIIRDGGETHGLRIEGPYSLHILVVIENVGRQNGGKSWLGHFGCGRPISLVSSGTASQRHHEGQKEERSWKVHGISNSCRGQYE